MPLQPKKILVFGTFDHLHPGHRDFFRQAARLGRLYVAIARDRNVQKIKNRVSNQGERSRLASVVRDPSVYRARFGHQTDFLKPVIDIQPDIIALGYDQETFTPARLKAELGKRGLSPRIVRLKPFCPHKFKSSILARC